MGGKRCCAVWGKKWTRKLIRICTLLKSVILETLNQKQELWGAQGLNFCSFLSLLTLLPRGCQAMLKEGSQMPERGLWLFASVLLTSGVAALLPRRRLFFIIFLTSVVHLSMARITIPEGIVGWCIDDARWGKAPFGTFQIKQLSVYDTVIWRWFTQPPLPSGCHLPSLHCWALRLGGSLTT